MRSGRRRGSPRWIRLRCVPSLLAPLTITGSSCFRYGNSCPTESASWTNCRALSKRKTSISRGGKPPATPMAMPGSKSVHMTLVHSLLVQTSGRSALGAYECANLAMPKWSRRVNGVTWWRSPAKSCLETLNVLLHS
jgi:hypothetical protein